ATAGKYQTAPASVAGFAPKTQYFSHSWHLPTARYDGCHSADGYGHTGGRVWLLHLCRHHQRCSRQHQYKCRHRADKTYFDTAVAWQYTLAVDNDIDIDKSCPSD